MPDHPASRSSDDDFVVSPDSAKLEALAEFAAGAGHEINNPLATIIGRARQLLKDETDPQRRQMLVSIGAQAYRIRDMIGDAMLFGRPPSPELSDFDLAAAINQVVSKSAEDCVNDRCTVSLQLDSGVVLRADPTQFAIVISELLRNSRHAMQPAGGTIALTTRRNANHVLIEITDHGRGFTEVERRHAFDPFFSGRQAGRGLGFGLAKCWRIVDQHQGRIEIQSSPAGPTTVQVMWPIIQNDA